MEIAHAKIVKQKLTKKGIKVLKYLMLEVLKISLYIMYGLCHMGTIIEEIKVPNTMPIKPYFVARKIDTIIFRIPWNIGEYLSE